ncbi:hypothetical protein KAR91_68020 [Candidatus Pacearchaeota archaeon]|nr:hypothetical protein [Candidatus Pacearchaeota archaeon]
MKRNRIKLIPRKLNNEIILPIISNAAIASPNIVDSRFIPILIVDTSSHKAIDDVVNLHDYYKSGDVDSTWAIEENDKNIYLFLKFIKPVKAEATLKFDILQYGGLVDTIMSTRVMYLQPGKEGDRYSNTEDNPRISIEIPDISLRGIWQERWKRILIKDFRSKGLSRSESKKASQRMIDEWRNLLCISMKERAMRHINGIKHV